MVDQMYNVVFENSENTGNYRGIRTWSSFKDKATFDKWYSKDNNNINKIVLAEGVTKDNAIEIAKKTPFEYLFAACFHDATDPITKEIDDEKLERRISNVILTKYII